MKGDRNSQRLCRLLGRDYVQPYEAGAEADPAAAVHLSFTLTRLQRIANPPKRLALASIGLIPPVGALVLVLHDPGAAEPWLKAAILILAGLPVTMLVLRRPLLSLYRSVAWDEYINTIRLDPEWVSFGIDGLAGMVQRRQLRASKGWCGTLLIRRPFGPALVLPQEAIPLDELERLIDPEDTGRRVRRLYNPAWEITPPEDLGVFIRNLHLLLPADAVLVVQGSPDCDVREFLAPHHLWDCPAVESDTLWPELWMFHIAVAEDVLKGLAELEEHHAAPEICDHLKAYIGDQEVLTWHDVPHDPWYAAACIAEEALARFCALAGCRYTAFSPDETAT